MPSPKLKNPEFLKKITETIFALRTYCDAEILYDDVQIQKRIVESGMPIDPMPKGNTPDARNVMFCNGIHSYIMREMWGHPSPVDNGRLMIVLDTKKLTTLCESTGDLSKGAYAAVYAMLMVMGEDPDKIDWSKMNWQMTTNQTS